MSLLGQRLQQKRWMATAAVNYKVDVVGELLAVNIVQKVPNNALYANSRKKLNSFLLFFRGIIVPCKICSGTALNLFVTISPVKKTLLCSSKAQRIISLSQLGFRRSSWIVGLGQKPGWYPSQKCVSRGVPNDPLDA